MPDSPINMTLDIDQMDSSPEEKEAVGDTGTAEVAQKADVFPYTEDAFGNEEHAEVKYKVLKWWYDNNARPICDLTSGEDTEADISFAIRQCSLVMIAETISLGVLALPAAIAGVGFAPAIVILIGLGVISTYTGYVIGQLKWRYPHVSSAADAGQLLLGRFGRELLFWTNMIYLIFIMASHLLTFTVALNTISRHATCSIVFGVVGLIASFLLALPRTLDRMSWLSLVSFTSIIVAVLMTMIAVGVQNPARNITPTTNTNLVTAFTSTANIIFSYSSHNTFYTIIAELRDPRDFPKSLALLQSVDISVYLVAAVVIYCYTGDSVASPALGSAGKLISRIAYGVALPTIIIAGVIMGHIACKSIYVRVFAGTDRMHKRDMVAVGSWIAIAFGIWVIAWIIASAIPVFNNLLSLIVSLFASWYSFGIPGIFWLWMNKSLWFSSPRKVALTLLNLMCICIGIVLCALGLYTSGKAIHDDPASQSFSCANNVDS